jgi:hypothetical protein
MNGPSSFLVTGKWALNAHYGWLGSMVIRQVVRRPNLFRFLDDCLNVVSLEYRSSFFLITRSSFGDAVIAEGLGGGVDVGPYISRGAGVMVRWLHCLLNGG